MTASLILRTPCEHGEMVRHAFFDAPCGPDQHYCDKPSRCPGGSEVVLDPEQVVYLKRLGFAVVQDIIDDLTGEEE